MQSAEAQALAHSVQGGPTGDISNWNTMNTVSATSTGRTFRTGTESTAPIRAADEEDDDMPSDEEPADDDDY